MIEALEIAKSITQTLNPKRRLNEYSFLKDVPSAQYILKQENYELYNIFTTINISSDSVSDPRISALTNTIESFTEIGENWDGYNAYPPTKVVIDNMVSLLNKIPSFVLKDLDSEDIYPNPNGTISLEKRNGENVISIEVGKEYATYYSILNGQFEKGDSRLIFPLVNLSSSIIKKLELV